MAATHQPSGMILIMKASFFVAPALLALVAAVQAEPAADRVREAKNTVAQSERSGQQNQRRIDQLDNQTRELLQQYRQTIAEAEQLALYNRQMQQIVDNQQQELASLDRQIGEIERTERGILPLMTRMLDSLDEFVELDTPFLPNERATRVALLRDMMTRADVTVSEKFRRVLEAYQIEVDYGRNIEAYRANDDGVSYEFLRIGRVALYRIANDGQQAWLWSRQQDSWQALDGGYLRDLNQALKVARQTAAPQLLTLPLPTLQGGAS